MYKLGSISSRLRESGFILLPTKERGRTKRLEIEPMYKLDKKKASKEGVFVV